MSEARSALAARVAAELGAPVSEAATRLADFVRERHGEAMRAVLFYGSRLRREDDEGGIHDFYAIVDDYRAAFRSAALARANAILPPNVFYCEVAEPERTLRAKVAVISLRDFARGVRPGAWRSGLWARFAQPARLVWVRDATAQDTIAAACVDAVCTAVRFGLRGGRGARSRVDPARFWPALFRATYAAELRPERDDAIAALYFENAARFDAALRETLDLLAAAGVLDVERGEEGTWVWLREPWPGPPRRLARVVSRGLGVAQLLKSAFTFGDWLPYVIWKIERHSGVRLEASENQRRYPLLFIWPLLLRALRERALR